MSDDWSDKSFGELPTLRPVKRQTPPADDRWSNRSFGELPTLRPPQGKTRPPAFPPPDPVTGGIMDDGSTDGMRRLQKGEVILDRYEVESELGQGGMGVVYRCLDRVGGVQVAVKALPPDVSHDSAEMEEVRDNFQLVVGLRHSCIAGVRTLEKDARGEYFLIMDVAEGESLRKWIRAKWRSGGLQPEEAVAVLRQVASALDYAHGQKVIHRDVKPGNVMIDREGHAKVLDFGLAAQIRTSLSRTSRMVRGTSGTGPYMSPEQWEAQPQDARADQYALGVMAYEMLAGHLPFENPEISVLREAVLKGAPRDIPGLAPKTMAAIRRAMSKNPGERFPSCGAFVDALEGKKGAGNSSVAKGLLLGAAALAAVAVVAAGIWKWSSKPKPPIGNISGLLGIVSTDATMDKPADTPPPPPPAGNPVEQALKAFRENDYASGFRLAMANGKDDSKLQYYLGMCYDEQEKQAKAPGAAKDDWTAKAWYEKSAQQGGIPAMNKLGEFAEHGRAGNANLETAKEWYQKAADAGSTVGKGHLARVASLLSIKEEDGRMAELRKQGYTIVGEPGSRRAVWREGATLPEYPHWITGTAEKTWRPEDGYAKANPTGPTLSELRWKPGVLKPGDPNCKSGTREGSWLRKTKCPDCMGKGQIQSSVVCSDCGGSGRKLVDKPCSRCSGTGAKTENPLCNACNGAGTVLSSCPDCHGNGIAPCSSCAGTGRVENPMYSVGMVASLFSKKQVNMGSQYMTCSDCRGQGKKSCTRCGGRGKVQGSCSYCRGSGHVSRTSECPECHGSGKTTVSEPCRSCNNGHKPQLSRCKQCNGDGFVWTE